MLSNGIPKTFIISLLAICTSANTTIQDDFRYISLQDLQSSITTFSPEGNSSYSQMLFDVSRNQIVVGARDGLFRLSLSKLKLLEYAKWQSSKEKRISCGFKGQSEDNCHNYIKILLSNGRQVFTCGTNAFSPQCSWREITNLSNTIQLVDGIAKGPYNPNANITAFLSENGEYYFAGSTDFSGSDSLISKSVANVTLRTKQYNSYWLNEPQFVGSFESDKFVYFMFREAAVEYMNCGKSIYSRIARVCKNDQGGGHTILENWTTFIKARLNCSISGDYPFYFNEIQSISYVSVSHTVYATFTTPQNSIAGSAVCSFNLTAIDDAFDGPFKYQPKMDSAWIKHGNSYLDHYNCKATSRNGYLLSTSKYQLMDSAVQATTLNPLHVSTLERFTHITVDVLQSKQSTIHVLYVATTEGLIKKLSLLPPYQETCIIEIWQSVPHSGISIRNMQFLKETNSLYVTTDHGMSQIPSSHCKRHTSKENCKNAMDPYCGWNERDESCSAAPDGDPHNRFWKQHLHSCPVLNTPIDGGWSSWSRWDFCQHKTSSDLDGIDQCLCQKRECNNPSPANGGGNCFGPKIRVTNCTVHGGWSNWSAWSACSATCGTAVKTRFRTCTNPSPAYGGRVCVGPDRSEAFCADFLPCPAQPTDGGWGPWSPWSTCTAVCGGGYQYRERKCDNPTPYNGGQHCKGNDVEYKICNDDTCSEKKSNHPTEWLITDWEPETKAYRKKRYRIYCKAPVKHADLIKISVKDESMSCHNSQCTSEESNTNEWGTWSGWTDCSSTCGGGTQTRTRHCKHRDRGTGCLGDGVQTRDCNTHSCESTWGCWSEWSPCNVSCGWGVKTRSRTCLGYNCNGPSREQEPCEDQPCEGILGWSNWTEWSLCDDNYEQHRKRKCFHKNPGPRMCQGKDMETRMCLLEDSNEIGVMGSQLEQNSCVSMALSFFFIGAIVGLMPSLIYLSYYLFRKKKDAIPSSPHYIPAEQNPYISVPTREKVPKKLSVNSNVYPGNGTLKSLKCYEDDYVPKISLKRNSNEAKNGHSKPYESDKFLYD